MKKLLLLVLAFLSLSACQMTEEITFNDDGSGMYHFKIDMSAMMKMGKGMNKSKDSLADAKLPEVKDTIIQFSDIISQMKDSIKDLTQEEKRAFKHLKKMSLRVQMDETKDQMMMSYTLPFKHVSELETVMADLKTIEDKRKGKSNDLKGLDEVMSQSKVRYSFNQHSFKRTAIIKEQAEAQVQDSTQDDSGLKQMMQIFKVDLFIPVNGS